MSAIPITSGRRVEHERIIERHYYEPAPVYERRVYVAPPYYGRPYAYADGGWRPRHFFPRPYWHYAPRLVTAPAMLKPRGLLR